MTWHPFTERRVRIAALAVAAAAIVAVTSAWQVARVQPVLAAPGSPALDETLEDANESTVPLERLVALAPFRPDRKNTPTDEATPPAPASASTVPGGIRLLGTVVGDGQPFAVCRLGTARARLLHQGDTLGGWTLRAIAPARVTFIDDDGALHELRLSSARN